ncbi:hypothetical protein AAMO2058_000775200 [Amorphochlora amoebiformis]|eukprot:1392801-Amorphochlora_amoeboformis.AAC.2
MTRLFCLALLSALVAAKSAKCNMNKEYPPTSKILPSGENKTVEWEVLNLDAPAAERWAHIVQPRIKGIQKLIDTVLDLIKEIVGESKFNSMLPILDFLASGQVDGFPSDYAAEVKGIAKVTGIHLTELFVLQVAYEIWGLCTSFVVQDSEGEIWHGRNLDFGLFPSFDFNKMEWKLTEALRPLVISLDVQRGGKTLYKSTTYAGFAGVITAMRPGVFSISVDSRFDNKLDGGLISWILGDKKNHELTFTVRQSMEDPKITTYKQAFDFLNSTVMIGPSYLILGGVNKGEGAVISKDAVTINVIDLESSAKNGSFYVLETNYDNWKPAPFFDDRRNPAKACLDQMGPSGLNGFEGMYNTLSGKPNLNKLTTYTTLMHVKTGKYESYRQFCSGECSFW